MWAKPAASRELLAARQGSPAAVSLPGRCRLPLPLPPRPSLPQSVATGAGDRLGRVISATAAGLAVDGEPDTIARLFDVSIAGGSSGSSGGIEDEPGDDDGAEVKPEPADPRPDSSKEQSPDQHSWPIYRPKPVSAVSIPPRPSRSGGEQDSRVQELRVPGSWLTPAKAAQVRSQDWLRAAGSIGESW